MLYKDLKYLHTVLTEIIDTVVNNGLVNATQKNNLRTARQYVIDAMLESKAKEEAVWWSK